MNIADLIRPDIATMEPYMPIFPFEVLAARLGRDPDDIIKLDANENPYGTPPQVQEALANLRYTSIPIRRAASCARPWPALPGCPPICCWQGPALTN